MSDPSSGRLPLEEPRPGALYPWVKRASYLELGLFAGLLAVWLLPGLERETFAFGLAHGIGFIALALLVWAAVLRREVPYSLLAATLTPAGPIGSVIVIEYLERRKWDGTPKHAAATARRGKEFGGAGPREAGGPHGPRHRQRVGSQGGMPTRSPPEAGLAGDEFCEM